MGQPDREEPTVAKRTEAVVAPSDSARRRHYGQFYGIDDVPTNPGLVLGNCQAESLRIVLDAPDRPAVRVPPVHEMTAEDLPHLERLLETAAFVVMQPIRDDYRGLPLGTRQVLGRLRSRTRSVTVPIVRFTGLHPFQAVLRVPEVVSPAPVVEYHDVREIARAAGLPLPETLAPDAVRAIAEDSSTELRRRESGLDVTASDLFDRPTFAQMRTINHPANPVWLALGERVLSALGSDDAPRDPGRPLLASIEAPREEWVERAWQTGEAPRPEWVVGGEAIDAHTVRAAQAEWYRANPAFVVRAVERLAPTIERWRSA